MDEENQPFGLTKTQLLPILEVAVGTLLTEFTVQARPAAQDDPGGNKRLLTFLYTTQAGVAGEVILFAKRCVWKSKSEAIHYRYLGARDVPTARLFGALRDTDGEEIIFLECLPEVRFHDQSEAEWRSLLSLLAQINACVVTSEYVPHLHSFAQIGQMGGGVWIMGLDANPGDEQLEADLGACSVRGEDRSALHKAMQMLFAQVAAQPQGLLHQDFHPDNIGWRGTRTEVVVFDLHKNALGPRFADVAPYLASPDWSNSSAFLDARGSGLISRREALSRHYLDEYARFGAPKVSMQVFREETAALFWMHKVSALWFLIEKNQQERIHETLNALRLTYSA